MAQDNTLVVEDDKASDVQDQKTLEEALTPEPVQADEEVPETKAETVEEYTFLSKYRSKEDAEKAFKNIQERATKAEQRLKEVQKEMSAKSMEEFKNMDYDAQIAFLLKRDQEREEALNALHSTVAEQAQMSDSVAIDKFIKNDPLLKDTGLADEFRLLATHPDMKEYSLDSIYKTVFKPKIDKLMGTKITIKEKKILKNSEDKNIPQSEGFTQDAIARMSPSAYEANREKILQSMGVRF